MSNSAALSSRTARSPCPASTHRHTRQVMQQDNTCQESKATTQATTWSLAVDSAKGPQRNPMPLALPGQQQG